LRKRTLNRFKQKKRLFCIVEFDYESNL